MEELYGGKTYQGQKAKEDKKKSKVQKAAIGFDYDNGTGISAPENVKNDKENNEEDDEDSDLDLDMTVDIMALNLDQRGDINKMGKSFGLGKSDFIKYLAIDIEEAEALKHAKEKEEEKAMYSVSSSDFSSKTFACTGFSCQGRKSRRERRIIREKQLAGRKLSPPSYAAKIPEIGKGGANSESRSSSSDSDSSSSSASNNMSKRKNKLKRQRTPSPKVEFITSFGGEDHGDDNDDPFKDGEARKDVADAKQKLKKLRKSSREIPTIPVIIGPSLPAGLMKDQDGSGGGKSSSVQIKNKSRSVSIFTLPSMLKEIERKRRPRLAPKEISQFLNYTPSFLVNFVLVCIAH